MILDVLRVALSPFLVAGASLASRRYGESVGGWLAGFPFVAGPILLVVALEQGPLFAALAARSALLGTVALVAFAVWFGHASSRIPWMFALASGWALYLLLAWPLSAMDFGVWSNLAFVVAVLVVGIAILPRPPERPDASSDPVPPHWRDIPLRMAATFALVCTITLSAKHLGPTWSGLLTPFPVATTVLAVFAHLSGGGPAVARFLRGFVPGLGSLAVFFAMLAVLLPSLGLEGFVWALACALLTHSVIAVARSRAVVRT
jgi:hypothetical protein